MIHKRTAFTLLFTVTVSLTVLLSCDNQQLPVIDDIAVNVNGSIITQRDISFASQSTGNHQNNLAAKDKNIILDKIIDLELTYQRAIELGLDKDPTYQKELGLLQVQVDAFKRKKLSDLLIRREIEQKTKISENEAKQYFIDNEKILRTRINVWQILRRDENSIKKVREELTAGASFEAAAGSQFAGMAITSKKPWDMGYLQWNQIPEAWESVINKLDIGGTSDIIRGANNRYWIIKVIDKHENADITFEQYKTMIIEMVRNKRIQQLRDQLLVDLRNKADIVYTNRPN